jgi:hypothetical protein
MDGHMRRLRSFIAQSPAIGVAVGALILALAGGGTATAMAGSQARAAASSPAVTVGITFHNLHLINGWKSGPDSRSGTAGYAVSGGILYLKGAVFGGSSADFAMLPAGARPSHILWIPVVNVGPSDGGLRILPSGLVSVFNNQANASSFTSLSGISFPLSS